MPAAYPIEPEQALKPAPPEAWRRTEARQGTFLPHRVLRFAAVGGFVCGVDLALVWCFSHWLAPTVAISIAYILAVTVHFCLNKWWVFESRDIQCVRQIWKYALTVFACWLCTLLVFSVAMRFMTGQIVLAKLVAIPPTTLLGYVLMKKFVFAPQYSRRLMRGG